MEKDHRGIPIIRKLPEPVAPIGPPGNPVVAVCGECGMDLHQVMHYVCFNSRCPTGLAGATFSTTNSEGTAR